MKKASMRNPRLDLSSPRVALYDGELRIFSSSFLTKFRFLPFTFSLTNIYLEMRSMKFWFYFVFGYTKPSFIQRSNKMSQRSSPSLIFRIPPEENIGQKWKYFLEIFFCLIRLLLSLRLISYSLYTFCPHISSAPSSFVFEG